MKIALAQIDTTVGDFDGNLRKVADAAQRASAAGARLVVAPELTVTGCPPRDFLNDSAFLARSLEALDRFASSALPEDVAVAVGYAQPHLGEGAGLSNATVVVRNGEVIARSLKTVLPTYDVFDESRYFDAGADLTVFDLDGVRVGLTIGEELWTDGSFHTRRRTPADVAEQLVEQGAQLLVNLSASPYAVGKPVLRERLMSATARRLAVPIAHCQLVGGNDAVVFDGQSLGIDRDGVTVRRAAAFAEDFCLVDLRPGGPAARSTTRSPLDESNVLRTPLASEITDRELDEMYDALVCGTRDYARKSGFQTALLGLSGGIDSALVAVIASDALGAANVTGVGMPSRFTEGISNDDAALLARNLGMPYRVIEIEGPFNAFLTALAPCFEGLGWDVTEENLQARVRGDLLMALSNKLGGMLLTTGNKSELATGYCTLYGDMCGGLAVIGDVPKTLVWAMSRRVNARAGKERIPARTIDRPPSAELRDNQRDQDSLPDYDHLDRILRRVLEARESAAQIARAEPDIDPAVIDRVMRLVRSSEYKRKQAAPAIRVSSRGFGEGWRFPLAHRAT